MTVHEKAVDRAKKIKAMADSAMKIGNEAEAQAFATKLQAMCAEHSISMSDLEWAEESATAVQVTWWQAGRVSRLSTWCILLAQTIAKANNCKIILAGGRGIHFIGTSEAAEAARSTMEYLHPAAARIAQAAYDKAYNALWCNHLDTSSVKGYKSGFLMGFITRLKERFEERAAALAAQFATHSTGLMRLSQSLRLAEDYIAKMEGLKQGSARRAPLMNGRGFADGKAKANEMNVGGAQVGASSHSQPTLPRGV